MLNTFLTPLGSPADADAAFFALVGEVIGPVPANFCDVLFDEGFNGSEATGRSFKFELVPLGAPYSQTPVWIGNQLQDTTQNIAVVTITGTERARMATNVEGARWRVTTPNNVQYWLDLTGQSTKEVQLKVAIVAPNREAQSG